MGRLRIERSGGLANLPAAGEIDEEALPAEERAALDALFARKGRIPEGPAADMFRYRITRRGPAGERTIDVPEAMTPPTIRGAVRERFP